MKKYITILLTFIFIAIFSQYNEDGNSFRESEKTANTEQGSVVNNGPGNPDGSDDLPINDYLPILFLAGLGAVVYVYRKKRTLEH